MSLSLALGLAIVAASHRGPWPGYLSVGVTPPPPHYSALSPQPVLLALRSLESASLHTIQQQPASQPCYHIPSQHRFTPPAPGKVRALQKWLAAGHDNVKLNLLIADSGSFSMEEE
ncbi:hypothetical protein BZA77DRAFT_294795 [Pyronema omphalodes]|nr:hypothetical protein BZA77DRAFT_294795 [Pyronema omphalodes]